MVGRLLRQWLRGLSFRGWLLLLVALILAAGACSAWLNQVGTGAGHPAPTSPAATTPAPTR